MQTELTDLLIAYLSGGKAIGDCAEWLAGIDWDDPDFDRESRNIVGRLELLATEVAEGLREEEDFRQEVTALLRKELSGLSIWLSFPNNPDMTFSFSSANNRTVQEEYNLEEPPLTNHLK